MSGGRLTDSPNMRRWPPVRARPLLPRHGHILTPEYASPEQLEGAPITTATAIYALGVVLSELLASNRPFCSKSGNDQQPVDAVLHEAPVRPPLRCADPATRNRLDDGPASAHLALTGSREGHSYGSCGAASVVDVAKGDGRGKTPDLSPRVFPPARPRIDSPCGVDEE